MLVAGLGLAWRRVSAVSVRAGRSGSAVDAMARQPGATARIQTAMITRSGPHRVARDLRARHRDHPALRASRSQRTGAPSGTTPRRPRAPERRRAGAPGNNMARRSHVQDSPKIPEMTIRRLSVYTRCLLSSSRRTASRPSPRRSWRSASASTRPRSARTSPTSASSACAASATTSPASRRSCSASSASTASGRWRSSGFGNLGSALFHYKGFARQGFRIAAIFDDDPGQGRARRWTACPIMASRDLARETKARGLQIAIVAVPAGVRPGGHRAAGGGRHQGHPQLRARRGIKVGRTSASRTWTSRSSWRRSPSTSPRAPADLTAGRRGWYL